MVPSGGGRRRTEMDAVAKSLQAKSLQAKRAVLERYRKAIERRLKKVQVTADEQVGRTFRGNPSPSDVEGAVGLTLGVALAINEFREVGIDEGLKDDEGGGT